MVTAAFCFVAASGAAWAQTPPVGRVARLTLVTGYVHVDFLDHAPGDPAALNMPLIQGQTIVTGEDGQAEVEFEDGSLARVTPNSSLLLARLAADGETFASRLVLARGLAYFELRAAPHWEYSVEAAGDRITPVENTTFRVNLDEPPAAIAVLSGTAHVERPETYRLDVGAGETLRNDVRNPGRYFLTPEIATDTWDQWNESRDQAAVDAAATRTPAREGYAGNEGYGWSDLDANGNWYNVPGQGQIWQPAGGDMAGFDPYANGNWVWYPRSGYLWASNYSWGWTPYRCGAWSYWDSFGWGWSPNGGCGGYGFAGFGGGGYGNAVFLNVITVPRQYPWHRIPPIEGGVHPIVRVPGTLLGADGSRPVASSNMRRIGGVAASPIVSVGHSYTSRGGSAVGSALQRDFPVERGTRTPVLGVQPEANRMHTGYAESSSFSGQTVPAMRPLAPLSNANRTLQSTPIQPGVHPLGQPVAPANLYHPLPVQPVSRMQVAPAHAPVPVSRPMSLPPPAAIHYAAPPAPSAPRSAAPAAAPAASSKR